MIEHENHEQLEKIVDRLYAASDLAVFAIYLKMMESEDETS